MTKIHIYNDELEAQLVALSFNNETLIQHRSDAGPLNYDDFRDDGPLDIIVYGGLNQRHANMQLSFIEAAASDRFQQNSVHIYGASGNFMPIAGVTYHNNTYDHKSLESILAVQHAVEATGGNWPA